ncbi:MAG TPA: SPFH domain-containing protein, partial [Polyangiaceae bacterium]|nr:SPFH domain-containing protein [Polyangiaceae bacterium]
MGLLDRLRGEFVDIIEWVDDSQRTLVWRFPRYENEIKNGAQLVVRPGQMAIFIDRGQVADVFEPGQYQLSTDNLPLLSTLRGWKYGFASPFKCEVYFISTRQVTDLKWGTPNPIMLRDADFGPLRVRAFGTYTLRAVDPKLLLKELVGTNARFETDQVGEIMRSIIVEAFSDLIGRSQIAALDLAAHYRELSEKLRLLVRERIDDEYGLDVPALFILNVSLPPEVEKALDARTSMGVLGDLGRYQQFQLGNALGASATGSGGGLGQAVGVGAGLALGQQLAHPAAVSPAVPPPVPGVGAPPAPPPLLFHISLAGQSQGPLALEQ